MPDLARRPNSRYNKAVPAFDPNAIKGFDRIEHVADTSFRDTSTVVIIPSREPFLHTTFVQALNSIMWPMNGRRVLLYVSGGEVGKAYDNQVKTVLAHPELSKFKYIATIEDDTLPPPDAFLKLYESIEQGGYDGVGGLYFTKGDFQMPMCYGTPAEYARTGVLEFRPRNVTNGIKAGAIVECNGIANGCSLFRTSVFRDIEPPYFQTLNELGVGAMTQDLFFCAKARRAGKRFAVDCRVRCAHMDWATGVAY